MNEQKYGMKRVIGFVNVDKERKKRNNIEWKGVWNGSLGLVGWKKEIPGVEDILTET